MGYRPLPVKLGFDNFTEDSIINGQPLLFDAKHMVVEILETATPNKMLLEAVKDLFNKGYQIALDDYVDSEQWHAFFPYIKLIKVDLLHTSDEQVEAIFNGVKKAYPEIKLLAEKVESYRDFEKVRTMGFDLFQGYFFSRPQVIRSRTLSVEQTTITTLVTSLLDDEVDITEVVKIIEREPSLSYKLLRYAQSPLFKRQMEVSSIKQAITNLGMHELKRFSSLLFANEMTKGKHKELNKQALCRAKFCELLENHLGSAKESNYAFLTGLFSLMDAMLDAEIENLLMQISVKILLEMPSVKTKVGWVVILKLPSSLRISGAASPICPQRCAP